MAARRARPVQDWQGKSVFVTGAGGFIGSHLTQALVEVGARVRALVRYNSANAWGWLDTLPPEVLEAVAVTPGDIRDVALIRHWVAGCDYGFHLAALISIPYSYQAARSYVDTNITGTLNLLEACRETDITRLVCTSTSEVYGTARYVPIDEAHPLQGQSPYSASKIAADQLAESFYRSFGLPVVILRPFNTYGPRQSMRAMLPNVIRQALAGEVVRVGNLAPSRDFNYVSDTVQGFLKAGLCPSAEGRTVNIGSGHEITMGDLITQIGSLMGKSLNLVQEAERLRPEQSEVYRLCADITEAQALLGYHPAVSLDEGLQRTIDWFSQEKHPEKTALYHV